MIIVLTNDDGIDSSYLQYAKSILTKYGTVYTVAPSKEQSAKGMSLTIGGFHFTKIDEFNYSVDGTPVDCVGFAINGLNIKPDFVFSGVNTGYNLGFDTKYSGTIGACLQAQHFGVKSVAFSADNRGTTMMEKFLESTLNYILDNDLLSSEYTLNVNFPRETTTDPQGILHTELFFHKYSFEPEIIDDKFIPNRVLIKKEHLPHNSDAYAMRHGYTSITKIKN
jgi:5'-nucleotidase